jgi:hypothetical protein
MLKKMDAVNEIEVKGAEHVGKEPAAAEKVTDITKMTPDEIRQYLDSQEKEKKAAAIKKKEQREAEKNAFVTAAIAQFVAANELLSKLKEETLKGAKQLYQQMFTDAGKEFKADWKNFTLKSTDGRMKLVVERQERFEFTEEAIVHINAIKDLFRAKFEGRNKGFYNLLDSLLMRNAKGDYDAKLLTKVRSQVSKLDDAQLSDEFNKLVECQRVAGSALYCRAYQLDENGKWKDVNVQFSSL